MKKILIVFVLIFALAVPAMAAGEDIIAENTEVLDAGTTVYVDNEVVIADGVDILTGVTTYSVNEVTPSDTSGLKAALLAVLGNYDAIIVEYEYQNTNNQYVSYLREVQPDYIWLCSAAILLVFIYCLFKMGVAIWKR